LSSKSDRRRTTSRPIGTPLSPYCAHIGLARSPAPSTAIRRRRSRELDTKASIAVGHASTDPTGSPLATAVPSRTR
jgi:hypothetical protein